MYESARNSIVTKIPALVGLALAACGGLACGKSFYVQSAEGLFPGISSSPDFPGEADLKKTDAVLITAGGKWDDAEKARVESYVKAGGGIVLVHDAISASGLVKGEPRRWNGAVPLFFTPSGREDFITRGVSNFDVADEMMQGFEINSKVSNVLATTWTPNRKHLKGDEPQPYVYGVSPMIWTQELGKGRIVSFVPGKNPETFKNPAIRALLGRALAWAGQGGEGDAVGKADDSLLTYPPGGPLSPEAEVASMQVHPDFKVELVASEPLVSKAINIDWDGEGRLWVVESMEYPEGTKGGGPESMYSVWDRDSNLPKPPAVNRPGRDRICRLEDTDGDGILDKRHVFADDLDLATSFCFYKDGVIVAQPPQVLYLRDTDGDGKSDKREVLYTGLGTQDTHSVLNNLRWGLDGWIYATHGYSSSPKVTSGDGRQDFGSIGSGIVRLKADGTKIEMVSAKSGNCWGVDITSDGELFFTQPTSGDLVMHAPVSDRLMAEGGMGSVPSWQVMIHLRPVKPLMTWEEIVENQPNDVIGSFTAACGCAVYEGGSWPDAWNLGYFTAEPTVHIVHHEQLTRSGVTFKAEKTREEEFSATRDSWSRQIDTRVGPDGQLYTIDFYNQAILHNDPRGPIHLWNNQAARPDRDHFFGRILRYRHREAKPVPAADLRTPEGRVAALGNPNREIRFRAQRLIEESDVKGAAKLLENAKGPARLHALWLRAAAGVLGERELIAALADEDRSVRLTAARVMGTHPELATDAVVKSISTNLAKDKDPVVRLQVLAALPAQTVVAADTLVAIHAAADDIWTPAAVARLAKNSPGEVLAAAMASADKEKQAPLVARLFEFSSNDESRLIPMLKVLGTQGGDIGIAMASLASLRERKLGDSPEIRSAINALAESDVPQISATALPLAARNWSADERDARLEKAVKRVLASQPQEKQVLSALGGLPAFPADLSEFFKQSFVKPGDGRTALFESILKNPSPDAARFFITAMPSLPQGDKAKVTEALLGRPESAIALTDALADGSLPAAVAGPQLIARLAEHPDKSVREHAAPLVAKFQGAEEAKAAVINRLLPEVMAPGDPVAGKALFQACAICHLYKGEGVVIGPVLEGMGAHGVEALLTHIVDPNREVEPSYHVWNVGTKDGRIVAGFISRETAGSLFIKNVGGETEIPRDQITSQTDTGKSLMPEGFESLGGASLRDLISYLRAGEQRFHILTFGKAATADGSKGVYLAKDVGGDRVGLKRFGTVEERGVPFQLQDPAIAAGGKNVIVLKGGARGDALSLTMPGSVELPANVAAGRLHLLGAVAGWGFPAVQGHDPLMTIKIGYADGTSEDIVLSNGVDIADHVAGVDVPGSARTDLTDHGQVRYLWRDLKKPAVLISKITLTSPGTASAPMVAAITLESPAKDGKMSPAPAQGGPAKP
ncbi:ThuA domain-containing protein [Luteolibacter yonseiensis]|uniref:ThuA domain-containing protein n=1 Tax=Luteolibacter yonseiensis TaxID=1144680 RepID=A0A934R5U5_9BACT|nr:PVC-type heme-binding CxxCH protein [Luteolibacter yonseiensis]MBK1816932.1 ThuA domain-containing protein [Luteolibacter yonseiensis]